MKCIASARQHQKTALMADKMARLSAPATARRSPAKPPFVHQSNPRRDATLITAKVPGLEQAMQPRLVAN